MLSLDYFTYLFKSKKVMVVFSSLIYLLIAISAADYNASFIIYIYAVVLCFVLPALMFMHVHDKRAADTYYSLPLKRTVILITTILFIWLIIYIPYLVALVIARLRAYSFIFDITYFASGFGLLTLIVVNTCLYMFANNVFDGVVMMIAYEVLPLILHSVLSSFMYAFVAGFSSGMISFIEYLSPVVTAFYLTNCFDSSLSIRLYSFISSSAFLIVFSYILYKLYTNREAENANSESSNPLAYPLIIKLYTFLIIMFFTGSCFDSVNVLQCFMDNIFWYVIVFALFVAAHFIYKRKFYFHWKMPAFYIGAIIVSVLFGLICQSTRGFNLSYTYNRTYKYGNINIYSNSFDYEGLQEIRAYAKEKTGIDDPNIYCNINIDSYGITHTYVIDDEVKDIIDKYRNILIEDFYDKSHDSYRSYTSLYIDCYSSDTYENRYDRNHTSYSYYGIAEISMDDLLKLVSYPYITISLELDYSQYQLMPDGELRLTEVYGDVLN
ncbi:MAG: hypothetical protein Q4D13_06245 [Erysipelotrichaceae bacterium]|nr:hypothetical protein [Erysipelotrichaceae bacterium]